ncbi:hypothetical protein [Brevundimonas sp.]|uniref:hypothetical protein n=2 Tax=Caulobacteraceae TaxID=76892 RepID=UPI0028A2855A|nr:hypothetical protein [Brevundimonas sp.]
MARPIFTGVAQRFRIDPVWLMRGGGGDVDSFEPKVLRRDDIALAAQVRFNLRLELVVMRRMVSKDSVITKILHRYIAEYFQYSYLATVA